MSIFSFQNVLIIFCDQNISHVHKTIYSQFPLMVLVLWKNPSNLSFCRKNLNNGNLSYHFLFVFYYTKNNLWGKGVCVCWKEREKGMWMWMWLYVRVNLIFEMKYINIENKLLSVFNVVLWDIILKERHDSWPLRVKE